MDFPEGQYLKNMMLQHSAGVLCNELQNILSLRGHLGAIYLHVFLAKIFTR